MTSPFPDLLLIDGFDEIATTLGIQGVWRKLRDTRFRAMQAVREIFRDIPEKVGVAISGRAHFFDSDDERQIALGVGNSLVELRLGEFTESQIQQLVKNSGSTTMVPSWLPARPLLVSYIVSRRLFDARITKTPAPLTPAAGWMHLIDQITYRESEIEAGIDGPTLPAFLNGLQRKPG